MLHCNNMIYKENLICGKVSTEKFQSFADSVDGLRSMVLDRHACQRVGVKGGS